MAAKIKSGRLHRVDLTGGTLLVRTLVLRRLLLREVLAADEKFVGILLPPSVAAVVANAAMPLSGRVAVNLNYTATSDTLNYCLRQCGIRHVLTSRRFMEKVELKLDAQLVYLEDFKDKATLWDKLAGAFGAHVCPLALLERRLGIDKLRPDDLLTVIFTSGSTGQPKGVMLSFGNVASNISAIDQVVQLTEDDVICGILPFFHSLGFTVTLWALLTLHIKAAYHFSPLGRATNRQVVRPASRHDLAVHSHIPADLSKADCTRALCLAGRGRGRSGKVTARFVRRIRAEIRRAAGRRLWHHRTLAAGLGQHSAQPRDAGSPAGLKEGTVGRPVPGVSAKVVGPESGAELPAGEAGLLLIQGPNVMQGYLGQPELTAKVMRDGWYVTGDMAKLDEEGFITITGRQSRFSKIGGEMVPHGRVEELLQHIVAADDQQLAVAVTATTDERKGERLLVLYTHADKSPEQMTRELVDAGLPNLWIPSPDSFFEVDQIPVLGTGKLDLQSVKTLAVDRLQKKLAGRKSKEES